MNKFNTKFLWGTLLIGLSISLFVYIKQESKKAWTNKDYVSPLTEVITIDSENWKEITFGIPNKQQEINWGAIGENVPFLVRINGGFKDGGYEYSVPMRKDWSKLKWSAPYFPNTIVKVDFKLAPCKLKEAKVAYTVRK